VPIREDRLSVGRFLRFAAAISLLTGLLAGLVTHEATATVPGKLPPPNILIVVADDLAYSDLGYYGSEIATPHLDALASGGARLDTFYAAPACSPTRAMLLTGVDHHLAGLGTMAGYETAEQEGHDGYLGRLNNSAATLAEVLRGAGYATFMAGKWHLGNKAGSLPYERGFDRSFALLPGGAGAFANRLPLYGDQPAAYSEDGTLLDQLPEDFYSTRFHTDRMLTYLRERGETQQPFFAYLAYPAPHWPLQSPREAIRRQRGKYDQGYDALRAARLTALRELGVVSAHAEPFPRLPSVPAWQELAPAEQRYQARVMEVYASMVAELDHHLGRLLNELQNTGVFERTLIFFMADNGPEGNDLTRFLDSMADCCDNSLDNVGNADSYVWLGAGWAQATNPPFRLFKAFTGEGGIRVPALLHYPRKVPAGLVVTEPLHVLDVVPTVLDAAGVAHPGRDARDRSLSQPSGRSLMPLLSGDAEQVHPQDQVFAFELFGRRAVRRGEWKAIYLPTDAARTQGLPKTVLTDRWQLFNLELDPGETRDLAKAYPEVLDALRAAWREYARTNGLIVSEDARPY
jgi:arylsulfatase A-like enzyme